MYLAQDLGVVMAPRGAKFTWLINVPWHIRIATAAEVVESEFNYIIKGVIRPKQNKTQRFSCCSLCFCAAVDSGLLNACLLFFIL